MKNIVNQLKGNEYYFNELDNIMQENGFYSIDGDGDMEEELQESKCIVYTLIKDTDKQVLITIDNINYYKDYGFAYTVKNIENY